MMNFTATQSKFINSIILNLRPYSLLQVNGKPVALYNKLEHKILVILPYDL